MKNAKAKEAKRPVVGVEWKEVNRALDFMNQHGLEEFEFASGDLRIRLKKPGPVANSHATAFVPGGASALAPAVPGSGLSAASLVADQAADNLHTVKSPIVGTFYNSPNPEAPPYVKVGDRVRSGQVLCIIEAMKLMNEIEADVSGEIVQVLATNAQPVEYGEGLFAIRPDGK